MRERSSKTGGRTRTGGKRYLRTIFKKKLAAHRSTAPVLENHHRLQVRTDSCHVFLHSRCRQHGEGQGKAAVVAVAARETVSLTLPDLLTVDSFSQCGSDLTGLLSYSCLCEFVKGAYLHARKNKQTKKKQIRECLHVSLCSSHSGDVTRSKKKICPLRKTETFLLAFYASHWGTTANIVYVSVYRSCVFSSDLLDPCLQILTSPF